MEMLDCVEETEMTLAMVMAAIKRDPSEERQSRSFIDFSTVSLNCMKREMVVMHVERAIAMANLRRGMVD